MSLCLLAGSNKPVSHWSERTSQKRPDWRLSGNHQRRTMKADASGVSVSWGFDLACSSSINFRQPLSSSSVTEVAYQHLLFARQAFHVVPPELKHLTALLSILGPVVDAANATDGVIKGFLYTSVAKFCSCKIVAPVRRSATWLSPNQLMSRCSSRKCVIRLFATSRDESPNWRHSARWGVCKSCRKQFWPKRPWQNTM